MPATELWSNIYIREIYDFIDVERKGFLSLHEYKLAMIILFGNKPTKREKCCAFGMRKNGKLCMKNFMKLVEDKVKFINIEEYAWKIFQQFDLKSKGFLELEDLLKAQEKVFPHLNPLLSMRVTGKVGRVSFGTFLNTINKK